MLLFPNVAEGDWKTISEEAKALSEQGFHHASGQSYEKAWLLEESETDLLVAAGTEYLHARNYKDAARVLEEALLDGSNAAHLEYKLGMALKGNGQYRQAIAVFSESLQINSSGGHVLRQIINAEIEGCEMALSPSFRGNAATVNRMSNEINSSASDYAAMAVGQGKLYFASAKSGSPQVYESASLNGSWTTPSLSRELGSIIEGSYGGGTFNRDMTEFYFSVCDAIPTMQATGRNCKIHKSTKSARGWSQPVAMRDYLNWPGATTTNPTIVFEGDTEVLYFTSNRDGGQGGMDIWYATREVNSTSMDFTFPINAGSVINSMQDDITPFYDRSEGAMYFSSNGHPNAGGLDVFKVEGKRNEWTNPENLQAPVNSSADDYYFSTKLGSEMAFLTSNRQVEGGQKSTSDDDIFEINFSEGAAIASNHTLAQNASSSRNLGLGQSKTKGAFQIKGRITDPMNGRMIDETYITLYKAVGESQRRKIETIKSGDGKYQFNMTPGDYYIVEAYKPGYKVGDFEFNTTDLDSGVSIDIPLDRARGYAGQGSSMSSSSAQSRTAVSETYTNPPARTTTTSTSLYTPSATNSTAVTPSSSTSVDAFVAGTEYRIQLTAVGKYDPRLPIFSKARQYGSLSTEIHPNGMLTRVFLRSFNSYDQAKTLVDTMKSYGFDTAFVVKYVDGARTTL